MPSDPTILAFDTSAAHCAVALLLGGEIVARAYEDMPRGQAERLPAMVDAVLGEVGAVWEELDAIGVGVGPGNFTGIRIGVSYARGLALGLGVPALGTSGLEIIALSDRFASTDWRVSSTYEPRGLACLPGPGDVVYQQVFEGAPRGFEVGGPETAPRDVDGDPFRARPIDWSDQGTGLPTLVGRTARKLAAGNAPRPAPLYIRPADAAPARHHAPTIVK